MKKIFISIMVMVISFVNQSFIKPPETLDDYTVTHENPRELTETEYLNRVATWYQDNSLKVVSSLYNEKGIAPSELPPDISNLINENTIVIQYIELSREQSTKGKGLNMICPKNLLGISCKTYDGQRDVTVSSTYGGVNIYQRVRALRYNNYSRCVTDCRGWEIEEQISWWTRTNGAWSVISPFMKNLIDGEDYCTENPAYLALNSSSFTVTWNGNQTSYYSLSNFQNMAYVPWPSGYSRVFSDIYYYATKNYDDVFTHIYWPRDNDN